MNCPRCKTVVTQQDKYCPSCGLPLEAARSGGGATPKKPAGRSKAYEEASTQLVDVDEFRKYMADEKTKAPGTGGNLAEGGPAMGAPNLSGGAPNLSGGAPNLSAGGPNLAGGGNLAAGANLARGGNLAGAGGAPQASRNLAPEADANPDLVATRLATPVQRPSAQSPNTLSPSASMPDGGDAYPAKSGSSSMMIIIAALVVAILGFVVYKFVLSGG